VLIRFVNANFLELGFGVLLCFKFLKFLLRDFGVSLLLWWWWWCFIVYIHNNCTGVYHADDLTIGFTGVKKVWDYLRRHHHHHHHHHRWWYNDSVSSGSSSKYNLWQQ